MSEEKIEKEKNKELEAKLIWNKGRIEELKKELVQEKEKNKKLETDNIDLKEKNRLIAENLSVSYITKDKIIKFIEEELPEEEICNTCEIYDVNDISIKEKLEKILAES